jgi:hypothetical protein
VVYLRLYSYVTGHRGVSVICDPLGYVELSMSQWILNLPLLKSQSLILMVKELVDKEFDLLMAGVVWSAD